VLSKPAGSHRPFRFGVSISRLDLTVWCLKVVVKPPSSKFATDKRFCLKFISYIALPWSNAAKLQSFSCKSFPGIVLNVLFSLYISYFSA
jgi:hypothetical protein